MSLKELKKSNKNKLLKYRYILMVILGIIIILLIIFIGVINRTEKNKYRNEGNILANNQDDSEKEELMLIELNKKKEEEREREREREKQEEQNARGVIYLTFDDGPSEDITPQILDILEQKNIKATFFVVHYDKQKEQIVRREVQNGHTVGLHGYSHSYSEVYSSSDACMENFRKIQQQVFETTGEKSNIIRFLGGSSNTVSKKYCEGIMTDLSQRVVNEGFKYFDWNIDSDDAGHAKTKEDVYNNVISKIKENRKNVILMHDFPKNQKTVDALPSIIDYGLQNGFVFRKITEDTEMVTHKIYN